MEKAKQTYLTIYVDIWLKKIWSVKAGTRTVTPPQLIPHTSLAHARQYALEKGFSGIRVKFTSWEI